MSSLGVGSIRRRVGRLTRLCYDLEGKIRGHSPGFLEDLLEDIEEVLETVLGKIYDKLSEHFGGIVNTVTSVIQSVRDLVDGFKSTVDGIVDGILENIGGFFDSIVTRLTGAISSIISTLSTLKNEFVSALDGVINKVKDAFSDALETIGRWLTNLMESFKRRIADLVGGIVSLGKKIWDAIIEFGRKVKEGIVSAYHTATETIGKVIREWLEKLKKALDEIGDRLEKAIKDIWKNVQKDVVEPFKGALEEAGDFLEYKAGVLVKAATGGYTDWDEFVKEVSDPPGPAVPIVAILGSLLFSVMITPAISTVIQPALENIGHLAREKFRPTLVDAGTSVNLLYRGVWDEGRVRTELARLGYADERGQALIEGLRPLPSPGVIQDAYLRGFITEEEHDRLLAKHGYNEKDIALFKALYQIIPGPSDLIRMAVREAFSPDIARKFGQYEDFPDEFGEWAEKQGLSREWAERYWASHWDLPSVTQGFEMLHRRIIEEDELKLLLKALDVMPWWREKLIQLSYSPYTRVDVRRMYQLGILDETGVYLAYRDLGYDEEKARNLTEFTIRYYTEEDKTELDTYRELTRTIYTKAYKKGLISYDDLVQSLITIGYRAEDATLIADIAKAEMAVTDVEDTSIPRYSTMRNNIYKAYQAGLLTEEEARVSWKSMGISDEETEWLLAEANWEIAMDNRAIFLNAIREKYVERTYTKSEAQALMGVKHTVPEEIRRLFDRWDLEREARTRKPTEAQFRAALKAGIITVDDYAEELRGLGYDEKYVEMLVKLAIGA